MHRAPSIELFNLYKHVCGGKIVGTELKAAFGKKNVSGTIRLVVLFLWKYICVRKETKQSSHSEFWNGNVEKKIDFVAMSVVNIITIYKSKIRF